MPGLISQSSFADCGGGGGGGGGRLRAIMGLGAPGVAGPGVAGGGSDEGVDGDVVTSSRASEASSAGLDGSREVRRRFLDGLFGDMLTDSSPVLFSKSCSELTSASPLTFKDSATLSKGPICSCETFISPLYMNSTTAFNSGHLISFRMTMGC